MKTNRRKIELQLINTRSEAEAVMNDLALTANQQRKIIAARDGARLAVEDKFADDLATLEAALEEKTEILRSWAEAHPEEFPKGRKSLDFSAGTLGFRTGTPKLALLSRAWTWEKVLAQVERLLPNFIRSRPEVDKESILGQRDELAEFLPMCGLKVTQAESFYVEPNLTETDARQMVNT